MPIHDVRYGLSSKISALNLYFSFLLAKKKNPRMEHVEPSYELPYISQWGYFLDFEAGKIINRNTREDRVVFDAYPIYLKHTLYILDENVAKLRKMEINQRFFAQDEMKEEGNWHYRKKNYPKAVHYYEYALTCL